MDSNTIDEKEMQPRKGAVAWKLAEQHIRDRKADILLLFDCCFAGMLCGRTDRATPSKRHFEFLGACAASQLTPGPGPKSFTRAMIESLKIRAEKEEDGFTIPMLVNQILNHKNFPKHKQTPSIASRTTSRYKMLLSPLRHEQAPPSPPGKLEEQEKQLTYCISLDFLFDEIPNKSEFVEFCDRLKNLSQSGRSGFKTIAWRSMYQRKLRRESLVPYVAHVWRERARARKRKRSQVEEAIRD